MLLNPTSKTAILFHSTHTDNYRTRRITLAVKLTPAQQALNEFAPKLGEVTTDVLFGDIWERPELSKRDRSLITVAALAALYRSNELPFHLKRALENGLTKDELIEAMTHLAFYAGWPCAVTALNLAKAVFEDST
jgi:4-carboxymuconolactone decarboxylase